MKIGVGATKALSLLVVWCMVCSAFAGMLVLMVPGAGQALSPSEVDGDIYIGQDFTISNWQVSGNSPISGDLVIRAGGVVTVTDGQLTFLNYAGHINKLVIEDGGQLILLNSTLKAQRELYDVDYALGVLVRNGGLLYAEDSALNFNGHLLVDDATLIAHRTVINGPLFTAMSADVQLYDSEMTAVPGRPMLEEETYSYSFAAAANQSVDVTYMFERNPDTVSTGQNVTHIQMNDSQNVTLGYNETLTVTGFDIGGLVFDNGEALSVILKAEYRTADDFDDGGAPDTFEYATYLGGFTPAAGMEVWETYDPLSPAATNREVVISANLTGLALSSIDLSVLSVNLTNGKAQGVFIDRIWVEVELVMPAYHNINIAGMSEFTAVNTLLEVNHLNYTDSYQDAYDQTVYKYRKLVAYDGAEVNLYGVTVEGEFFVGGETPYVVVGKAMTFQPSIIGANDTTIDKDLPGLLGDDGYGTFDAFYVDGGEVMNIGGFLTGNLTGAVSDVSILVKWMTDVVFSTQRISYQTASMPLVGSDVYLAQADVEATQTGSLTLYAPTSVDGMSSFNIYLNNTNAPDTEARIGYLKLVATINPTINIYRWINATVVDSNNLPVMGATVNATQSLNGLPASYLYDGMESTVPPQGVLDYLGRNATSFKLTDIAGQVTIPVLTDIINADWVNNSYAIPGYNISVDYANASAVHFVPGPIYSWFDPFPVIGEEDQSMDMLFILEDLELDLPDVQLLNFSTDPVVIYQGDEVTLNFQVINNGLTTASSFVISVVDSIGVNVTELGTIPVTNLLPGETRDLSLVWLSNYTTAGTHSIVITADALDQVMEYDENNVLTAQVQVLKYLPDLAVDGTSISFSPSPGIAQEPMYINVTVSNVNGKAVAQNAAVRYYLGDPSKGGVLIGSSLINVAKGGTNVTSLTWSPTQIGTYPIFVTVNEGRLIEEYNYSNNVAFSTLAVILEGGTNDLVVTGTLTIATNLLWQNNIIVEGDGQLSLVNMLLYMNQVSTNKPIQIVVRDNGTLVLDNSVVDSNYVLRIYLFDNGSLALTSSVLRSNVILIIDDDSVAYMEESSLLGDLQAPASSSAELVAVNTTFSQAWSYFGGTSTAEITGVSINDVPAVSPVDGAMVTIYSWIVASVYDGSATNKIPGASVEARSFLDQVVYATGVTDANGEWRFRALSDVITASGQGSVICGYYELNATYWYLGVRYDSDSTEMGQIPYSPDVPLVRSDALVRLNISTAKPNLDVILTPSVTEVMRGGNATLTATINNNGVTTAHGISIKLWDETTSWSFDAVIESLAPGSVENVEVNWTANYPLGSHTLSATVDPLNLIHEFNEGDNYDAAAVNVLGSPDLSIQPADIAINPVSTIQDEPASITANVRNIGDDATSSFNVSFYDGVALIGRQTISNLPRGTVGVVSVTWTPTAAGNHVITVVVDEEGIVAEADENNNEAQKEVNVGAYPDLTISLTFEVGGIPTNQVNFNTAVTVVAHVSNAGITDVTGAVVKFYLTDIASNRVLIGQTTVDVIASSTSDVSIIYRAAVLGHFDIDATVNEDGTITEYVYTNNDATSALDVIFDPNEISGDWVIDGNDVVVRSTSLTYQKNITIEDNGRLELISCQLFMAQKSDSQPSIIVVRDHGTLVLEGASLGSNLPLRIYLYDNARLFLNGSSLSSSTILIMKNSSSAFMNGATVQGDLIAPSGSQANLDAFNTSFSERWAYFGGSAKANLTGVSIGSVQPLSPSEDAVITLYTWIEVSVWDGTGMHRIPNAQVQAEGVYKAVSYSGDTDENGIWLFRAISEVVTSTGRGYNYGYYDLTAVYSYGGDDYLAVAIDPVEIVYDPDVVLVRSDVKVDLDIPGALPDIDPPFEVSNNTVYRGGPVALNTAINNIGVVTAYDIVVRFKDNTTGWYVDYLIESIAPGSQVNVSVNWAADYPLGDHTLSVMVDPLNLIPELNEGNNYNSTVVTVLGVPDMAIQTADITVNPASPIRDKNASITANVRNIGDDATSSFNVSFYDGVALIGRQTISNLPRGTVGVVSVTWTPTAAGNHVITVVVDEEGIIYEVNAANNIIAWNVAVRDYPDLVASSVRFAVGGVGASSVYVNSEVTVLVDVYNVGESPADAFQVAFWLNYNQTLIGVVNVSGLAMGGLTTVSITWVATIVDGEGLYQNNIINATVNPWYGGAPHISEMEFDHNNASQVIEVVDNRPDMAASNGRVQFNGANVVSATIGQKVFVLFDLKNIGIIDGTDIKVRVSLVNETINMLLFTQTVNVEAGRSMLYNVSYVVNVTSGNYTFVVYVDAGDDSDQSDNVLEIDFAIVVPSPLFNINLGNKYDYAPGTSIFVQGTVTQSGSNAPLAGQTVKVRIVDSQGFPLTDDYLATTNANGQFTSWVLVPSGKEGTQRLQVTMDTIEGEFSDDVNINIVAPFAPETIPSWVYLLIVAIVIAVIVIFSLYLYRVGLGRMVECGNCGALIPEASRHCPKCGVEFESDTAKCSECGAWIPSKAESCPDCGAKFMTEPVEAGQAPGYIEAMRKQYDEYIEAFRGQAKAALGSKYSEEKFMEWLQTEPNYLPFEEWLRKEEMSRRSGVFPCPACGTLNPRDSKICNRCGTVFEQQGKSEAPKAEEKKSPFRRIVRRSSAPKEAPKESAPEVTEEPKPEESGDKPQQ